jgi:hypothetical protein
MFDDLMQIERRRARIGVVGLRESRARHSC